MLFRSLFIHDITTANKNKNEYGFLRRSSASTHLFGKLMSVFIKANHVIWGSSLKKEPDIIRLIGNNNDNPEVIEDLIDVQMGLDIEYTYKYFGFRGHGILKGGYAHPPTRPFEVSGPVYFKNKQIGSIIVIRTSLTGEAYVAIYDSKGVQIN